MSKKRNSRTQQWTAPPPAYPAPPKQTCMERVISTDKLTSGLPYQRPVDDREVDRLVREWDERLFEPLAVSYRDGRYYVIDGQHRIAAMRRMHGGREVMIRCKVYNGMTYMDEAELCYKLDKAKKRLSLAQSTNALAESGTNAEIMEIRELLGRVGLTWALGKSHGARNEIVATRAVINSYRALGSEGFLRMFALISSTWRGNPRSLLDPVITGTTLFLKTYGDELNDAVFIKRLSGIDPDEIIRRGRADVSTSNAPLRYARIILEKFNSPRGGKKLAYRFQV